jgi:hypothetical protein
MAEEKSPPAAMGTAGVLYMVGTAALMLFALQAGLVNPGAIPIIGITFVICAVACLMVGIHELRRGDILFGSIDMVFGALIFGAFGLVLCVVAWSWANLGGLPDILQPDMKMAGWLAVGVSICLVLFLPAVGKVSWVVFLFFLVLAVGVALAAWGFFVGAPFGVFPNNVSGWLIGVFALFAFYAGTVFIVNTVYQAPKLPIGGPIF